MSGKKKSGWGGARPGAGAPKKPKPDYDEKFKKQVLKAARELQKEHGISIEKAMLSLIYDEKAQASVKASVFKTYVEMFVTKHSAKDVTVDDKRGPVIGLPPMREDPAKIVAIDGGKKDGK